VACAHRRLTFDNHAFSKVRSRSLRNRRASIRQNTAQGDGSLAGSAFGFADHARKHHHSSVDVVVSRAVLLEAADLLRIRLQGHYLHRVFDQVARRTFAPGHTLAHVRYTVTIGKFDDPHRSCVIENIGSGCSPITEPQAVSRRRATNRYCSAPSSAVSSWNQASTCGMTKIPTSLAATTERIVRCCSPMPEGELRRLHRAPHRADHSRRLRYPSSRQALSHRMLKEPGFS
jgi:hypothetical protein